MSIVSFALERISGAIVIDIVNGSIMSDACEEKSPCAQVEGVTVGTSSLARVMYFRELPYRSRSVVLQPPPHA